MARSLSLILALVLASGDLCAQEIVAQKISASEGNFIGPLRGGDDFGRCVASLGDLDGDGVVDLVVGSPGDDDAGSRAGAVWVLFLNSDGTVKSHNKIVPPANLNAGLSFGRSVDTAGDVDGNGAVDIVVTSGSSLALVYLDQTGFAIGFQKIMSSTVNTREGVAHLGDFDDDGWPELAMGNSTPGANWLDFYLTDPISSSQRTAVDIFDHRFLQDGGNTGFADGIDLIEEFGTDTSFVLAVGHSGLGGGGADRGAVWFIGFSIQRVLQSSTLDPVTRYSAITSESTGLQHVLRNGDGFGADVANLGDLDDDGIPEIAVGAPGDNGDEGFNQGALWIVFLNADYTPRASRTIGAGDSEFRIPLANFDLFGTSVTGIGDLDDDGIEDLAVGAPGNEEEGGLWILTGLPTLPSEVELVDLTETPVLGQDILVEAEILGVSDIQSAELHFRRGGDPTFFSAPMDEGVPGRFSFQIPAFAVDSRGIEYFVTTTNSAGSEARAPSGKGVRSIRILVPDGLNLDVPFGNATDAYRLVSFPLDLDAPDARTTLEASLGLYDPAVWRLFSSSKTGTAVDLGERQTELTPGYSYWLLAREESQILNSGAGLSIATATPFPIQLQQGWTLVGSPFNYQIPITNLISKSGVAIDMRSYSGSWSAIDDFMDPLEGYAVFSENFDTMWVDADRTLAESITAQVRLSNHSFSATNEWTVRVSARSGRARDTDSFAGVLSGAADEWDQADRPEPPTIGDYLSVYFPHPEWNRTATRFSTDLHSNTETSHSWTIAIESKTPRAVDLLFENLDSVPRDIDVWLVDEAARIRHNLREDPEYSVVSGTPTSSRTVQLVVNPQGPFEGPSAADLNLEIFPNPFVAATSLAISLPIKSRATLKIFDSLGREIAVLVDDEEFDAGSSVLIWDGLTSNGSSAASGLYLARLETGRQVVSRGLTISN